MKKRVVLAAPIIMLWMLSHVQAAVAINVNIGWSAPTTYEDGSAIGSATLGYDVYRATLSDLSNAVKLNSSSISGLTYTDSTVASKSTYYYYIVAYVISSIPSQPSNTISVKTWPPNKPPVVTVTVN